MHIFRLYIQ